MVFLIRVGSVLSCFLFSSLLSASGNFQDYHFVLEQFQNAHVVDPVALRQASLNAMNEALSYYNLPSDQMKPETWEDPKNFHNALQRLWKELLEKIEEEEHATLAQGDQYIPISSPLDYLEKSIKYGIIPIPSIDRKKDFRSSEAFINALFVGIAPIDVTRYSKQQVVEKNEHPIRYELVQTRLALAEHDFQHAARVAGRFYYDFRLDAPTHRLKFKSMMDSVFSLIKEDLMARQAFYYLIREDNRTDLFSSENRRREHGDNPEQFPVNDLTFVDYNLEKTMTDKAFSLSSLMGPKADLPNVCSALLELDLTDDRNFCFLDPLIPVIPFYGALVSTLRLDPNKGMSRAREIRKEIFQGMAGRMQLRCRAFRQSQSQSRNRNDEIPLSRGDGLSLLNKLFIEAKNEGGESLLQFFFKKMKESKLNLSKVTNLIRYSPDYRQLIAPIETLLEQYVRADLGEDVLQLLIHHPKIERTENILLSLSHDQRASTPSLRLRVFELYLTQGNAADIVDFLKRSEMGDSEDLLIQFIEKSNVQILQEVAPQLADLFLKHPCRKYKGALQCLILKAGQSDFLCNQLSRLFVEVGIRATGWRSELHLLIERVSLESGKRLLVYLTTHRELWREEIQTLKEKLRFQLELKGNRSIPPESRTSRSDGSRRL